MLLSASSKLRVAQQGAAASAASLGDVSTGLQASTASLREQVHAELRLQQETARMVRGP
jgi:hypothetical protein